MACSRTPEAFSGFAVDDLEAAKKFYGETLGLKTSEHYGNILAVLQER